nr:molybdenum cofactor biosynthesis protein MoaE [Propionibacterium sp.]
MPVLAAHVTDAPLDLPALLTAVEDARSGAVVNFVGRIRDHDPEAAGEVVAIDYTAHPDAPRLIGEIAGRVAADLDPAGEARIAVAHRIGRLAVGDLALVACVASPHRALAFAVCAELVEAVKRDLPIWKQQFEADGRQVWSNLGLADA